MAEYNIKVPWGWLLAEKWPKLSSGAQALYLDVFRLAAKAGWTGKSEALPYRVRVRHKDIRTGQCPEAFRRARRELCRVGLLWREIHGTKYTVLRDYFSLRPPPVEFGDM